MDLFLKCKELERPVFGHVFQLFRHFRLTELAKAGFNEAHLRKFAGWSGSSKMADVYIHLSSQDIDDKLLEISGIKRKESREQTWLKLRCCPRCGNANPATFKVCEKCWLPLDLATVMELEEESRFSDQIMDRLIVALQADAVSLLAEAEALRFFGSS